MNYQETYTIYSPIFQDLYYFQRKQGDELLALISHSKVLNQANLNDCSDASNPPQLKSK